jgi:hypothetical protein
MRSKSQDLGSSARNRGVGFGVLLLELSISTKLSAGPRRQRVLVGTHFAKTESGAGSPPLLKREIAEYAEAVSGYEVCEAIILNTLDGGDTFFGSVWWKQCPGAAERQPPTQRTTEGERAG